MGFEFETRRDREERERMAKTWIADRRLWLDESMTKVLEDGDPDARHLLVSGPGRPVSAALVEQYKLKNKPKARKRPAASKAKKAPAEDK